MVAKRFLIVNADDFGQSPGINRGIIEAFERGIVTSASLMVRWPATTEAAGYSRLHPTLGVGLHVDLGEWAYRDDRWVRVYEVAPADDRQAVAAEVARQLEGALRRLLGRDPSHIDSHQHVHHQEPVHSILVDLARELDVPLRHYSARVRYCGNFYGQTAEGAPCSEGITVDGLIALLATFLPGVTELGCHPGTGNDVDSMYGSERAQEVKTLCDPRVRAALLAEQIELCSFRSLPHSCSGHPGQ